MDDLDFSKKPTQATEAAARVAVQSAAQSSLYNPALAMEFFRVAGTLEEKPGGKPIFAEGEKAGGLFSKGPRMYLLVQGEVGLMVRGSFFGVVKQGEIFGELAVVAGLPRSATAVAKTDCRVLSLDEKQFLAGLQKSPEFALMLMATMTQRLRQSLAKLGGGGALAAAERSDVLDKKTLEGLQLELGGNGPAIFAAGKVIMSEGAAGAYMYVVTEGRVAISVAGKVVERVGVGGMFGEMALVDRSARAASAVAESHTSLLAISRKDFLDLVKSRPAFGASLLKAIAERMQQIALQVAQKQG